MQNLTLNVIARAAGMEAEVLLGRARALRFDLASAAEPCPAELIAALSRDEPRRRVRSGLSALEKTLHDVGWETARRAWRRGSEYGLGLLTFGEQEIVVFDDEQAWAIARALRAARCSTHLHISGGPGTGKDSLARACHEVSGRSGSYVAANCAALTEAVADSELSGVKRRSVTTVDARPGLFRQAHGGTLHLDEVGDMPLGIQPKVLRALEPGFVKPVGAEVEEKVDVFVITASNCDIPRAVATGAFRIDLWSRIASPRVELPSLCGRYDAIITLALRARDRCEAKTGRRLDFSFGAIAAMVAHEWPGNVREIEDVIEDAIVQAEGDCIWAEDLSLVRSAAVLPEHTQPQGLVQGKPAAHAVSPGSVNADPAAKPSESRVRPLQRRNKKLAEAEKRFLELAKEGKVFMSTWKELGVSRATLYRWCKDVGILPQPDPTKPSEGDPGSNKAAE